MPISTPLQTQIEAIQARIQHRRPQRHPRRPGVLAKAIEAIAGQATVIDVVAAGDAKVAAVSAEVDSVLLSIQQATNKHSARLRWCRPCPEHRRHRHGHPAA